MFSYGEIFLLLGATIAVVGPKDVPKIAKAFGRLAGRAVGYVQSARGQFEDILHQSQANQVHKELQDTMAQLDAIRHEIRNISFMNPSPLVRNIMENAESRPSNGGNNMEGPTQADGYNNTVESIPRAVKSDSVYGTLHCKAEAYSRIAQASMESSGSSFQVLQKQNSFPSSLGPDHITVLPVSAESAGLLPKRKELTGSDVFLEAILEADVAHQAKEFFKQTEAQSDATASDVNTKKQTKA